MNPSAVGDASDSWSSALFSLTSRSTSYRNFTSNRYFVLFHRSCDIGSRLCTETESRGLSLFERQVWFDKTLVIGDRPMDMIAGQNAGMATYLFDSASQLAEFIKRVEESDG